jgi:hypothetical protein
MNCALSSRGPRWNRSTWARTRSNSCVSVLSCFANDGSRGRLASKFVVIFEARTDARGTRFTSTPMPQAPNRGRQFRRSSRQGRSRISDLRAWPFAAPTFENRTIAPLRFTMASCGDENGFVRHSSRGTDSGPSRDETCWLPKAGWWASDGRWLRRHRPISGNLASTFLLSGWAAAGAIPSLSTSRPGARPRRLNRCEAAFSVDKGGQVRSALEGGNLGEKRS